MISFRIRRLDWPDCPVMEQSWELFDDAFARLITLGEQVDALLEIEVPETLRRPDRNAGYSICRFWPEQLPDVAWSFQYRNAGTYVGRTAHNIYMEDI